MLLIFVKIVGMYFCITGTYDTDYPEEYKQMINKTFTNKFQYLTIIGLYITLLTLSLYLINQMFHLIFKRNITYINKISNLLHAMILPIEVLITLLFWSLFIYNPKLIVCEIVYEKCGLNVYKNICLHFIPFLLLAIEAYHSKLTRSNIHIVLLLSFGVCYYLFVKSVAEREKRWPYPFLERFTEYERMVVFFVVTLLCIVFYEVSMYLLKTNNNNKRKTE